MHFEENSDFKKPILIGKPGKFPKKITNQTKDKEAPETATNDSEESSEKTSEETSSEASLEERILCNVCPYKEPSWSGVPEDNYQFDILKQGKIIGNIDLTSKSFWVFGRLPQCDISMAHPTVSRYHAILQYRITDDKDDKEHPKGYYLYDLNSTHGTFLNKLRVKPQKFMRVQVGHMIKLGCSSRMYILSGPEEDAEEESQFTITELKEKRAEELRIREQLIKAAEEKALAEEEARKKREEERGIDWGMGEDADEESDMLVNPFAETNNEELYLDDPKKALRGFMDREGHDFEYDCKEQGMGQFLCRVELPVDDEKGRPVVAEVLHKGKKKEAVVQCALEACRILDKYGLLRQATHESRKRKAKNWEENDYYDSDDDTFLDRTGTIEKKRERRMKAKQPEKAETYESLLEKEKSLNETVTRIEKQISAAKETKSKQKEKKVDEDSLDQFMEDLKKPSLDKDKEMTLKRDLLKSKQELSNVRKLLKIAKPFELPAELQNKPLEEKKPLLKSKAAFFGKRIKVKVERPQAAEVKAAESSDEEEIDQKLNLNVAEDKSVESLPKEEVEAKVEESVSSSEKTEEVNSPEANLEGDLAKKRKKNLRRIQHRQEKQEQEKQKGYEDDSCKEDYNMWLPPENQTGDGKTALNNKYNY